MTDRQKSLVQACEQLRRVTAREIQQNGWDAGELLVLYRMLRKVTKQ